MPAWVHIAELQHLNYFLILFNSVLHFRICVTLLELRVNL